MNQCIWSLFGILGASSWALLWPSLSVSPTKTNGSLFGSTSILFALGWDCCRKPSKKLHEIPAARAFCTLTRSKCQSKATTCFIKIRTPITLLPGPGSIPTVAVGDEKESKTPAALCRSHHPGKPPTSKLMAVLMPFHFPVLHNPGKGFQVAQKSYARSWLCIWIPKWHRVCPPSTWNHSHHQYEASWQDGSLVTVAIAVWTLW